jgi:hypothetical protein
MTTTLTKVQAKLIGKAVSDRRNLVACTSLADRQAGGELVNAGLFRRVSHMSGQTVENGKSVPFVSVTYQLVD